MPWNAINLNHCLCIKYILVYITSGNAGQTKCTHYTINYINERVRILRKFLHLDYYLNI